MSYSEARISTLLLDTTPSLQWNNLSACPSSGYVAFAHKTATVIAGSALEAQTSSTDRASQTWRLPPPPPLAPPCLRPRQAPQSRRRPGLRWRSPARCSPLPRTQR